nr:ABC-F family ATP-binding cassette domain-containing protein [Nitrospiraceae bacterium]
MLQVSDLSKSYGTQVLFENISFVVGRGERVGLVGRNGHGKSTLFKLILDEEHPDSGTISTPTGYRIGHLDQHIRFSHDTVLAEACSALPPNEDHIDESWKAESILHGLGFTTADFERSPDELSGGYQVRLNLAKVLASEPNLLLLDEPTNYLDIVSLRWLTGFLRAWRNEVMIITHDRDFMDGVTTHTMGIHRRKIRKIEGPTRKLYDQIIQEEEVYEKTRANDEKKRQQAEQFIQRFRAQATKAKAVQSRIKALERHQHLDRLEDIKTLDFLFRSAPFEAKWLFQAENLSFSYGNGPRLIDDFSLSVAKKDRIAIIGKNGKGKTTLLNLLTRETRPAAGSIAHHPNVKLAYFGQTNIERLSPMKTIVQEILDTDPDLNQTSARSIAGTMMFEGDNALKKVRVLSGGEKSRVLLAKLLVSPANLLVLDEPTNHLDMESVDSLVEAIENFDGALIIVTHSEMILKAIATKLVVFDDGRITVFDGTYQDFLERVGWADEGGPVIKKKKANRQPEPKPEAAPPQSRKDARKLKADITAERSKAVSGLKSRIQKLEAEIMKLEEQVKADTQALVQASTEGKALAIRDLTKAVREGKAKADALF